MGLEMATIGRRHHAQLQAGLVDHQRDLTRQGRIRLCQESVKRSLHALACHLIRLVANDPYRVGPPRRALAEQRLPFGLFRLQDRQRQPQSIPPSAGILGCSWIFHRVR